MARFVESFLTNCRASSFMFCDGIVPWIFNSDFFLSQLFFSTMNTETFLSA